MLELVLESVYLAKALVNLLDFVRVLSLHLVVLCVEAFELQQQENVVGLHHALEGEADL